MSVSPHILTHSLIPERRPPLTTSNHSHDRYALSFTSGGLLVREADVIVADILRSRDWVTVRHAVTEQNLLQARTTSSSVRVTRETIQRLGVFDDSDLNSSQSRASPSAVT